MSAVAVYEALGLTAGEYSRICVTLGREPTHPELAMFSVMWSEHCSYKSSRTHLKELPAKAAWLVAGPGENAGVVEAAPGLQIAFKIESHNHPSAIAPFQGAATGVGGIVRDILALGARPVAVLDSLRFGPLNDGANRSLFDGVVRGIAAYGNALGLPTVGGEAVFDPVYDGNPLVNAMCVGVVEGDILRSAAGGEGQLALLFGSPTGREGIGGASILASAQFREGDEDRRPSVQVGDPFMEKLLIEACLQLKREGVLSGLQDLGAAGITCALSETAAAAGLGVSAGLDAVPLRAGGMQAWEILMSESQERMLACIAPGNLDRAVQVCRRWGLDAVVLGTYTGGGRLQVSHKGRQVADVPAEALAEGIVYDRPMAPRDRDELLGVDPLSLRWPSPGELLLALLSSPSIASKAWVWTQYDHMVRLNTLVVPGADAALLRLPEQLRDSGLERGIALATDGPGRMTVLDPWLGGALAVCESARNVATLGARPLAVTNCLNFPSPENPEVMFDFRQTIEGIAQACRAFGIPVTGGNVSFYNEGPAGPVHPTPVVGMLGVLDDAYAFRGPAAAPGDLIVLLGTTGPELGGSEALAVVHGLAAGRPPVLDLGAEVALARLLGDVSLGRAAHDLSEGGLAVGLAEMAIRAGAGVSVELRGDPLAGLFSESFARAIVAVAPDEASRLLEKAGEVRVDAEVIGTVGGDVIEVQSVFRVGLDEARAAYEDAIPSLMGP